MNGTLRVLRHNTVTVFSLHWTLATDKVERGRQDPFTVYEDEEVHDGKLHTEHIVKTTPKWML